MDWKTIREQLQEKAKTECVPFSATLELTPLCNFSCKMCYVRLDRKIQEAQQALLTAKQWIELAEKIRSAGVFHLTLTGGELFFRPDIKEIYETLYDMGFVIDILSNGYLINDEILAMLTKRKPQLIRITLYGASNMTYEKVCGVKKGFDRVTQNILALKHAGITVKTSMTVIKDNEADFEKVCVWTKEHELALISTCRLHLPMRGAESLAKEERLVPDDYCTAKPLPEPRSTVDFRNNVFCLCKCYRSACVITWQGHIQGCMSIASIYEDAFSDDFLTAFQRIWQRLSALHLPEKCEHCKLIDYCMFCPGSLASESGDPEVVKPYVCAMANWTYDKIGGNKQAPEKECD